MKAIVEKLNKVKVDDDGITLMEKFVGTKTDITLKITTHGFSQFMSLMKDYKETYLDYPSGNFAHL